jgi:hypothetical protein
VSLYGVMKWRPNKNPDHMLRGELHFSPFVVPAGEGGRDEAIKNVIRLLLDELGRDDLGQRKP